MNDRISEEQLNRILGYTGEIIEYKDYITGEDKKYSMRKGDEITEHKCPIDNTPLLYIEINQVGSAYCCPNCENAFRDISKEGLERTYEKILKTSKERLKETEKERSHLIKIIEKLEKVKP